ncbi:MAG: molybdenum cofactor guanylyltransferase [Calditrichaeota bacterium]|nr:MAG: molybdenum cofactor guanylyltransferase [Calditrichota bacterium]
MNQELTGIILAGGKNLRFGSNKALIDINGKTVIELTADLLKTDCSPILINTNSFAEYSFLNLPLVRDEHPSMGPLAGLYAGLSHSPTERALVISCDMPLMSRKIIACLATYETEQEILITRAADQLQFFPGIYRKTLLPTIEHILAAPPAPSSARKGRSMYALIEKVKAEIIDLSALDFYREEQFFNMNTREDYDQILRRQAVS